MSSTQTVVDVRSVSKKYCRQLKRSMWYGLQDLWTEVSVGRHDAREKLRPGEFYALRDISFTVDRGECVALIGPNGAGKSTMMKMLNGLIKPSSGEICVRGKVGALIELGAGFNPILSGRENVFINGAVLRLDRKQIEKRFDDIVAFSEIGDAINAPVKTYSSGMRMRLGFSVAAHLRPGLLLLDEVLAVGDVGFRMKCFEHLNKLRDAGTAIIVVSHAVAAMSRVAHRGIVFGAGRVAFDGPMEPAIAKYEELVGLQRRKAQKKEAAPVEDPPARISKVVVLNGDGAPATDFQTGDPFTLRVHLQARESIPKARLIVSIESPTSGQIAAMSTAYQDLAIPLDSPGRVVDFRIPQLPLLVGAYFVTISLYGQENTDFFDRKVGAKHFKIVGPALGTPGYGIRGVTRVEHRWDVHDPEQLAPAHVPAP